jgi:DNA-binding transcriptional ArsR family regulator
MNQASLFDDDQEDPTVGMVRATDPETSHVAAAESIDRKESHQRLALTALHAAGGAGLTDFELAAVTGVQQTSIGKRRGELRDAGLVCRSVLEDGKTRTRPSPSASPAIVWELTDRGITAAEGLAAA